MNNSEVLLPKLDRLSKDSFIPQDQTAHFKSGTDEATFPEVTAHIRRSLPINSPWVSNSSNNLVTFENNTSEKMRDFPPGDVIFLDTSTKE